MVFIMRNTSLGFELLDLVKTDALLLEEFVELKRVVSGVEVVIWGSVGLFETGVLLVSIEGALKHSSEVDFGENTVVGHEVVSEVRLITVGVGETGSIGMSQEQWHEGISIIDSIKLFAFHELLQVVLDNGFLSNSCALSSSGLSSNAISEGKDVLKSLVLQGVWVNINKAD